MKKKIDKLAVFDLDGTLYKCNSHTEVINWYYKRRLFDYFFIKVVGKIAPSLYMKIINYLYRRIENKDINKFNPPFRESARKKLHEKKNEGFEIVIVSNAPDLLIECAATRLNVNWLRADVYKKNEVVENAFIYNNLFVCTDNKSDTNLLEMADERLIYVTKKSKRYFENLFPNSIKQED